MLGPPDIEREVGLTGGHIFQGECLPAYMWDRRLSPRTPMPGVFLCGACTHPGGSVIAVNGRNAAMEILGANGPGIESRALARPGPRRNPAAPAEKTYSPPRRFVMLWTVGQAGGRCGALGKAGQRRKDSPVRLNGFHLKTPFFSTLRESRGSSSLRCGV